MALGLVVLARHRRHGRCRAASLCRKRRAPAPRRPVTSVIGDTPYGERPDSIPPPSSACSPTWTAGDVETLVHLGDIKNGDSRCDDAYFAQIDDAFESIDGPGRVHPGRQRVDRLPPGGRRRLTTRWSAWRRCAHQFFADRTRPLGPAASPTAQGGEFLENVRWTRCDVVFATVHVVGSANGSRPWEGSPETPENAATPGRRGPATNRRRRGLGRRRLRCAAGAARRHPASPHRRTAVSRHLRSDPTAPSPSAGVLVVQGDTHQYVEDHPVPRRRY